MEHLPMWHVVPGLFEFSISCFRDFKALLDAQLPSICFYAKPPFNEALVSGVSAAYIDRIIAGFLRPAFSYWTSGWVPPFDKRGHFQFSVPITLVLKKQKVPLY